MANPRLQTADSIRHEIKIFHWFFIVLIPVFLISLTTCLVLHYNDGWRNVPGEELTVKIYKVEYKPTIVEGKRSYGYVVTVTLPNGKHAEVYGINGSDVSAYKANDYQDITVFQTENMVYKNKSIAAREAPEYSYHLYSFVFSLLSGFMLTILAISYVAIRILLIKRIKQEANLPPKI